MEGEQQYSLIAMKELISIIDELHAPKNKTNTFGKFNYRDAAGILEAVKPLLKKYNCLLNCDTDVVMVGERYYVKATAEITNADEHTVTATALAREQDSKSGMDAAQLTGACISYAKKYALCNLFCIDDSTDDPDTDDSTKKQNATSPAASGNKASNAPSNGTKPSNQATAPTGNGSAAKTNEKQTAEFEQFKVQFINYIANNKLGAELMKYMGKRTTDYTYDDWKKASEWVNEIENKKGGQQ